jgi:hypothetical protein
MGGVNETCPLYIVNIQLNILTPVGIPTKYVIKEKTI